MDANPTNKGDHTSFDASHAATPNAPTCTNCSKAITTMYHEADGQVVCSTCRAKLESQQNAGGGFFGALGYGLGGAAIGAVLWFAVLALFNLELGLLAIVVGFLVGKGVHKGSGGRGGWRYQTLAVALTYSAIVVTYIPFILKGMAEGGFDPAQLSDSLAVAEAPAADAVADTTALSINDPTPAGVDSVATDVGAQEMSAAGELPIWLRIGALLIGAVLLFVLAASAPILAGLDNIIGLLIIGFALYEAWSLNKRNPITFTGPYRIGAQPAAGEGTATA